MKVSAFGRDLQIVRDGRGWCVYDVGSEGKRRKAADIRIPDRIAEEDIVPYLSDILHEYASPRHPHVYRVDASDEPGSLLPPHMPAGTPPPNSVLADRDKLGHINTYGDLPTHYRDYPFVCRECGVSQVWTAEQQKWYYEEAKGHIWAHAVRCRACRQDRKSSDNK